MEQGKRLLFSALGASWNGGGSYRSLGTPYLTLWLDDWGERIQG